jgi:hypothetical protein
VYQKVPRLLLLLYCLSEGRWEGKPRSQFWVLKAYCISLPCDTLLWLCTVFTRVFFQLHVLFCLQWMAKSNVSASSFAWSSVNLQPKPSKCFMRLWRTSFRPDSGFWMAFMFQGGSSDSWRWQMFRVTENVEKIWELMHEDHCHTIPELAYTIGISYSICQKI